MNCAAAVAAATERERERESERKRAKIRREKSERMAVCLAKMSDARLIRRMKKGPQDGK